MWCRAHLIYFLFYFQILKNMYTLTTKNLKLLFTAILSTGICLLTGCESEQQDTAAPLAVNTEADIGPNRPNSAYHNKTLADIRSATTRFFDVSEAEAKGYMLATPCVAAPGLGGMGFHYVKEGIIMDGTIDPEHPEALVYEPQKNGKLKLVAIEYIVDAASWHAQHDGPPMLGDQVFDSHLDGAPLGFPHYQLHVWVWKHNPSGMHAPFNPTVTCMYAE